MQFKKNLWFTKCNMLKITEKFANVNPKFGFTNLKWSIKTKKKIENFIFTGDLHKKNIFLFCVYTSIFVSLTCFCCLHTTRRCFSLF